MFSKKPDAGVAFLRVLLAVSIAAAIVLSAGCGKPIKKTITEQAEHTAETEQTEYTAKTEQTEYSTKTEPSEYTAKTEPSAIADTTGSEATPEGSTENTPAASGTGVSYDDVLSQFRQKWAQDSFLYSEYAYHDIDEDGQQELIIHDGIAQATRTYYFYGMRNNSAVELGSVNAWHSTLVDNDGRLLIYAGMGGEGTYSYISITGDGISETAGGSYTFPPVPDFGEPITFTK